MNAYTTSMIMTCASVEKLDYTEEPKTGLPPNIYWWIILLMIWKCNIKHIK